MRHSSRWRAQALHLACGTVAISLTLSNLSPSYAGTLRTWTGANSANWTTTGNWSGSNVPDTTDEDAYIPYVASRPTVTVNGAITVGLVTIDPGAGMTIQNNSGLYNMTVQALSNSGTVTLGFPTVAGSQSLYITGSGMVFNTSTGTMNFNGGTTTSVGRNIELRVAAGNTNNGTININNVDTVSSNFGNHASLFLFGSLENNGTINLNYTGNPTASNPINSFAGISLFATADMTATLSGTGTVQMSDNARNWVGATTSGTTGTITLVNGQSHSIVGSGLLGNDQLLLQNNGLIKASGANVALTINPLGITGTFINSSTGRLVASGAAGLTLTGGLFTNNGLMEARTNSKITIAANTPLTLTPDTGEIRGGGTFNMGTASLYLGGSTALTPGNSANNDGTGASTVGALAITGKLQLSNTTPLNFQLGAPGTAGIDYDTVNVSSNLTLDGVLNLTNTGSLAFGTYHLFSFASGKLTDNGLTFGTLPADPGFAYRIVTNNTTGIVDLLVTDSANNQWAAATAGPWATDTNWTSFIPNAPQKLALFGSNLTTSGTVTIASSVTVGSITFDNTAASYTLDGGTITLDNDGIGSAITVSSGSHAISSALSLNSNTALDVAASSTLTFSGSLTGNSKTLAKTGSGKLQLTGSANTLGASISAFTMSAGTLDLGALTLSLSADLTFAGGLVQNGAFVKSGSDYLAQSGTISAFLNGSAGLTKTTSNTLTLSSANAYTGATTINAGILSANTLADGGSASSIGASTNDAANLVLNGGTLRYTGPAVATNRLFTVGSAGGTIEASGTGPLTLTNANSIAWGTPDETRSLTLSGTNTASNILSALITDNGLAKTSLTKSGTGTWILTATNHSYTGATTINAGTLSVSTLANGGAPSSLGASTNDAANLVLNGGTLLYTGSGNDTDRLFSLTNTTNTIDASGSGPLHFTNPGALLFGTGNQARTLILTGSSTADNTLAAVINNNSTTTSNYNTLIKNGSGTWTLSGANTYGGAASGGTIVNAGTLVFGPNARPANDRLRINSANGIGARVVLESASPDTVRSQLLLGYNAGAWSSNGYAGGVITSTSATAANHQAIGYMTGTDWLILNGANAFTPGHTVTDSDVLLRYTYAGDADLDGKITTDDYLQIDTGYLFGVNTWYLGDFNYDGLVDANDYLLIDNAFKAQGAPLADDMIALHASWFGSSYVSELSALASVPEPASLALLALGATALLRRQRK